jgi:PBSX family phage terminase large subunit
MKFKKTPKQKEACKLLVDPNYKRILLRGGSRSGKTFIIIRQLIVRAIMEPNSRHLVVRFHFKHAKTSLWLGTIPEVLRLCFKGLPYTMNSSDFYIKFENGSELWIGGLDDKERSEKILGNEYSSVYFNEAHQLTYAAVLIALTRLAQKNSLTKKAYFDCNPPTTKHWIYSIWFLHVDPISKGPLPMPELYATMLLNPRDNQENISEDYITTTLETMPERQRKRFLDGLFQDDVEGALWNSEIINNNRVLEHQVPQIQRMLLGVDPAVTAHKDSDETGIIRAGKGTNGHYYIFEDETGIYTPNQWGQRVVRSWHENRLDKVVAEVNQGGDLVESNIRNIDRNVQVKKVHAFRGKILRAEPIVGLYEMGLVHHVGILDSLETEMTEWDAKSGAPSPNRIDALVHVLTELSEGNIYKKPKFNF